MRPATPEQPVVTATSPGPGCGQAHETPRADSAGLRSPQVTDAHPPHLLQAPRPSQGGTHLIPVQELEAQDMLQLPQADGAEVQGPPQRLVQAEGPLHEAAEPAAAPQAQEVAEPMAGGLRETVPHRAALSPHPRSPGPPGLQGERQATVVSSGVVVPTSDIWRFTSQPRYFRAVCDPRQRALVSLSLRVHTL